MMTFLQSSQTLKTQAVFDRVVLIIEIIKSAISRFFRLCWLILGKIIPAESFSIRESSRPKKKHATWPLKRE